VSPTGTLAYTRSGWRKGRIVDLVVRRRGDRRRVIGYAPLVQRLFWISRHRLVADVEYPSLRRALVEIRPRPKRSRTLPKNVGSLTISQRRRVAYSYGRPGRRRIAVTRLDGSHRRSFRSGPWEPSTWAPDGGTMLLTRPGDRIGLMNARTGAIRRLGTLPCGYLTSAVWTRPGEHVWPPPR
jgi:hypothetical protein